MPTALSRAHALDAKLPISTVIIAFSAIAILGAPANIIGNALVARNNQNLWLMFALVSSFILVASCYLTINMGVWSGVVSLALSSGTLTFLAFSAARSRSLI